MPLLCSLTQQPRILNKVSILLAEMPSKSPVLIKCWHRCLNHNLVEALKQQGMCEAIFYACLHLTHSELSTSPSLNGCPFKWQCPVSNHMIILSWCLLRLSNSPAFFSRGSFKKACLSPWMACQGFSCFPFVQSLISFLAVSADMPGAGSGLYLTCKLADALGSETCCIIIFRSRLPVYWVLILF